MIVSYHLILHECGRMIPRGIQLAPFRLSLRHSHALKELEMQLHITAHARSPLAMHN